MLMNLKYVKTRDVKDPQYGTGGSVGIDFFVPVFDEEFMNALFLKNGWLRLHNDLYPRVQTLEQFITNPDSYIIIPGHKDLCIPSGVHMSIPPMTGLFAMNKSGVALTYKFVRGAEVIDWDYQGEIHCHVINTSDEPKIIRAGMKIVQFVHLPVYKEKMISVGSLQELYPETSERGEGGFGSTDKK